MKSAIEQSIKEKIKALAKERETTFTDSQSDLESLEKKWISYRKKLKMKKNSLPLVEFIKDVILFVNQWLCKIVLA